MRRLREFLRRAVRKTRDESGQSAAEYAMISWAILFMFGIAGVPMFIALLQSAQVYFDSYFLVLRLPIP